MYTLRDDFEASEYDLYQRGDLVATLHYVLSESRNEITFRYCEAVETLEAAHHCKELMRRASADVRRRRMTITVTCPITLKVIRRFTADNDHGA